MTKEKTLTLTQAAKQLGTGKNSLLARLRAAGLLHASGTLRNAPTKAAVKQGLLRARFTEFYRGPVRVQYTTAEVTAKGLVWIDDLLDRQDAEAVSAS
ncbi:phage antirepressor KilAC domain-containing protein [Microbulbifer sp. JSM ZJ756]|uniref:phage antirepressor KilAC domain-containing protein n=1 Tax=Microbulbifer sp. JSM ZJ756 TaxID=3376191 RepID=UPI0037B3DFF1